MAHTRLLPRARSLAPLPPFPVPPPRALQNTGPSYVILNMTAGATASFLALPSAGSSTRWTLTAPVPIASSSNKQSLVTGAYFTGAASRVNCFDATQCP